ncbi:MAG: hypothetical protein IPK19_32595 [Chloroflexi bacterium]|nr:hypothetical protein [Chloroflexota bacterium]
MSAPHKQFSAWFMTVLSLAVLIMVSGCNLSGAPEQTQIIQTETPSSSFRLR